MSFKVDFSKMKKVSDDGKFTIMQHPDGHEIKIANHALSKPLRNQLKKLQFADSEKASKNSNFVPEEAYMAGGSVLARRGAQLLAKKAPQILTEEAETVAAPLIAKARPMAQILQELEAKKLAQKAAEEAAQMELKGRQIAEQIGIEQVPITQITRGKKGELLSAESIIPGVEEKSATLPYGLSPRELSRAAQERTELEASEQAKKLTGVPTLEEPAPVTEIPLKPKIIPAKKASGFAAGGAVHKYAEGTDEEPAPTEEPADESFTPTASPDTSLSDTQSQLAQLPGGQLPTATASLGEASKQLGKMPGGVVPQELTPEEQQQKQRLEDQAAGILTPSAEDPMGLRAQQKAIQQSADIEKQLSEERAAAMQSGIYGLNELTSKSQETAKNTIRELDNYIEDIKNQHIDPNRFLGNMDTGNKIMTSIALALGGYGAGLSGGPNQVLNFLNQQIDRDIQAQKSELGKRETLYSAALKKYQTQQEATNMTRLLMQSQAIAKLDQLSAKYAGPMAQAKADQMKAALMQQMAPALQQMSMRQSLLEAKSLQNVDPTMFVPHLVPQEHQKQVFGEIEAAQNTKHMANEIMRNFDQAVQENTVLRTGAGLLRTPASVYALHQAMQPTFKDLEGTVRQAAMDNTFKNITPAPGDMQHTIDTKRQALEEYLKSKASAPTAKAFGIDLSKFSSTVPGADQAPIIKTMGGVQYKKVPNGWQKME